MKNFMQKNKLGFSLFEVVVTMSIVAIFVAASTHVFTKRHTERTNVPIHGRFECYWEGNQLKQRLDTETPKDVEGSYCEFRPNDKTAYLIINIVGGGGAGSASFGGFSGVYKSQFLTALNLPLLLYPGKGATYPGVARGERTTVKVKVEEGDPEDVLVAEGGFSATAGSALISACTVSSAKHICPITPRCAQSSDGFVVTHCVKDSPVEAGSYTSETITNSAISTMISSGKTQISKDLYTVDFNVLSNNATQGEVSEMIPYLVAIDADANNGALNVAVGNGGNSKQNGHSGAVVIVW